VTILRHDRHGIRGVKAPPRTTCSTHVGGGVTILGTAAAIRSVFINNCGSAPVVDCDFRQRYDALFDKSMVQEAACLRRRNRSGSIRSIPGREPRQAGADGVRSRISRLILAIFPTWSSWLRFRPGRFACKCGPLRDMFVDRFGTARPGAIAKRHELKIFGGGLRAGSVMPVALPFVLIAFAGCAFSIRRRCRNCAFGFDHAFRHTLF